MTDPRPEHLDDSRTWLRLADSDWTQPLDTSYAYRFGGRWNAPMTRHTLYLCEDEDTARVQVHRLLAGRFLAPEDLRDDAYILIPVQLTADQKVADAITDAGLAALGLPSSYPVDHAGHDVPHAQCQAAGDSVAAAGLSGVHARSATATAMPQHRELAWFPGSNESAQPAGPSRPYRTWR